MMYKMIAISTTAWPSPYSITLIVFRYEEKAEKDRERYNKEKKEYKQSPVKLEELVSHWLKATLFPRMDGPSLFHN